MEVGRFFVLMEVGFAMVIIFTAQYNGKLTSLERFIDKASLAVVSMSIGVIALLWLALVFRCPKCRANVGKFVITETQAATWLNTFLTLSSCPKCGDGAGENQTKTGEHRYI